MILESFNRNFNNCGIGAIIRILWDCLCSGLQSPSASVCSVLHKCIESKDLTLLVGRQDGCPACKKLGVGVCWW